MDDEPTARERWNARYRGGAGPDAPAAFLTDRADLLPASGRALDLAGGTGRHAVWLAARGLEVTLVDVADGACASARERAAQAGVRLTAVRAELGVDPLPAGPFAVVLAHHYLDRAVWRQAATQLAPAGVLLACQPTVTNLERHDRPSRRWLLDDGEVHTLAATLRADGLEVLEAAEGWTPQGRHEARLVVRRPG